jgi:hypothetical protein
MQTRGWALPLTLLLSLVIPGAGAAQGDAQGPLVKALRSSVMNSFRDSPPDGYVPDPYCASGENGGAVGIHFVKGSLVDDVLNPVEPEVLYYEPLPGGRIRLVGAEYVYFEVPFGEPPVTPQHLEGHLLNYMVAPNRFGIPFDWLRLNVWAWKHNPNGTFAGDNPNVSCDAYDPNLHPQPQP